MLSMNLLKIESTYAALKCGRRRHISKSFGVDSTSLKDTLEEVNLLVEKHEC